jgi:hypothetical protein
MVTISVPAKSVLAFQGARPLWWTAAFVFGILLVGKNRGKLRRFMATAALLIISAVMISCGGSSGGVVDRPRW